MIYITNIFDLKSYKPRSKDNIFQVVVMDPPWSVRSKNPTRGVALKYLTLSSKNKKKSNFLYLTFLLLSLRFKLGCRITILFNQLHYLD
eukprot:maker-scaffold_124-snap-gene-0.0-mRNA-1 protein AED:0.48 eAED:0.72 QI:0/0/0/1/0/0/2/0/88